MPRKRFDQLTIEQAQRVDAMFQQPWAGDPYGYTYEVNSEGLLISRRPITRRNAPDAHLEAAYEDRTEAGG